jgi:hypothetical protein
LKEIKGAKKAQECRQIRVLGQIFLLEMYLKRLKKKKPTNYLTHKKKILIPQNSNPQPLGN